MWVTESCAGYLESSGIHTGKRCTSAGLKETSAVSFPGPSANGEDGEGTHRRSGPCSPWWGRRGTCLCPLQAQTTSQTSLRAAVTITRKRNSNSSTEERESLGRLHVQTGRKERTARVCLACFAVTYDVGAERPEGVSPARVQMGRVEPLQETDVIETLRLQHVDKALLRGGGNTEESGGKRQR